MNAHEVPTHLSVPDRALLGLTVRQMLALALGAAAVYWLANALGVPFALPFMAGAAVAALASAFWRPHERPFEDWAFVLLRYAAAGRVAVWRRQPGRAADVPRGEIEIGGDAP